MNCQDVAKLRTPLDAVCQTTDIGCVPIVDGKPTCNPQPDELPFAFDPSTNTLWLFSCKTREWLDFTKFNVCQLDALNLDNITNICDILNIAVNYSGSGECKQGTITLGELAERILECLKLETKIITIGQGEGNKLKITIDGLPLDPVYVTGRNIWSEGGSGTEADPLRVATHDPICKWPTKNQAQVDAANTKHLGACVDGEMSRVPFPPKVCELPSKNQAQVDAAASKELIACVDGEGVKVPYPPEPCGYPQMTEEQVMSGRDRDLIVCVDGQEGKVPVPDSLFDDPICSSSTPNLTLDETRAKEGSLKIVSCDGERLVKIPLEGTGFFSYNTDWKYQCVPLSDGFPNGRPSEDSGPLRIDCNGNLYVWLCDQNRWERVTDSGADLPWLNPNNIPDICNNFRMRGWYSSNADPCVQDVQFTLGQLAQIIQNCFNWWDSQITTINNIPNGCDNLRYLGSYNDSSGNRVIGYVTNRQLLSNIEECSPSRCRRIYDEDEYVIYPFYPGNGPGIPGNPSAPGFELESVTLVDPSVIGQDGGAADYKIAIWNFWRRDWDCGSGTFDPEIQAIIDAGFPSGDKGTAGRWTITLDNPDGDCIKDYSINIGVRLAGPLVASNQDFSVCLKAKLLRSDEHNGYRRSESYNDVIKNEAGPTLYHSWVGYHSKIPILNGPSRSIAGLEQDIFTTMRANYGHTSTRAYDYSIAPGESLTLHLHAFIVISSRTETTISNVYPSVVRGASVSALVRSYKRLLI